MANHHPAKFDGHMHCGSGDMKISVNTVILPQMWDIRGCICPLTSAIIIFFKAHEMSCATDVSNDKFRNSFYGNFF